MKANTFFRSVNATMSLELEQVTNDDQDFCRKASPIILGKTIRLTTSAESMAKFATSTVALALPKAPRSCSALYGLPEDMQANQPE